MTTVQQIRKRDGRVVPFHENKIADAINKAFEATYKPAMRRPRPSWPMRWPLCWR